MAPRSCLPRKKRAPRRKHSSRESPLDDANIERFCDLMDAMTRETATRYLIASQCHPDVLRGLPWERTWLYHPATDPIAELLDAHYGPDGWPRLGGGPTVLLQAIPLLRTLGFRRFLSHFSDFFQLLTRDGNLLQHVAPTTRRHQCRRRKRRKGGNWHALGCRSAQLAGSLFIANFFGLLFASHGLLSICRALHRCHKIALRVLLRHANIDSASRSKLRRLALSQKRLCYQALAISVCL